MNQKELKQEIDSKSLRNFYIFCSDDYFLKKVYFERMREVDDFDVEIMDIENEEEINKVLEHINSQRLFLSSSRRLIYVRIHYIITETKIKNKGKNIVILDPIGCKNVKHKNLVTFKNPDKKEMRRFIGYKVNSLKKKINEKAADLIIQQFENKNATSLNIFMDKVLLYIGDKEIVEYEDVTKLVDNISVANVFKIVEYILQEKENNFFESINILFESTHPSVFITIMSNELIKILAINYLKKEELDKFKINTSFSLKYRTYLENIGEEKMKKLLDILYDMDLTVKSLKLNGFKELFKARMFEWFRL